jgi:hypothetical protein
MREPAATCRSIRDRKLSRGLLRISLRLASVLIAAFGARAARAGPGQALPCSPAFDSSQSLWAAADFDGDKSVDLVRIGVRRVGNSALASGVDIFAFCKNSVPPIFGSFPQAGLILSARDIDADRDQDLVLRDRFAGEALGVWLNDGMDGFSEAEPADFPGAGDDPPGIRKRASRLHQTAVSSSSRTYASLLWSVAVQFTPRSACGFVENPTNVTSGWQTQAKVADLLFAPSDTLSVFPSRY